MSLVLPIPSPGGAELLGRKGAGLHAMAAMGLPVPPGFTLTTPAFAAWTEAGGAIPDPLDLALDAALAELEARTGRRLGDPSSPLLVSLRVDAPVELVGLMESVLDLGITEPVARALADADPAFGWDLACRFALGFADTVMGVHAPRLARLLEEPDGATRWTRLRQEIEQAQGPLPADPRDQVRQAIRAAFESYRSPRACYHRKRAGLPETMGMCLTVQAMVLGTRPGPSGTGRACSRDPETGRPGLIGAFLPGGQGHDLRRPSAEPQGLGPALEARLAPLVHRLEASFRDAVDVEFTIEDDALWLLQATPARRSPSAALHVARDLVHEGLIDQRLALARLHPRDLERLLRPSVAPDARRAVLARGIAAAGGAASGRIALGPEAAQVFREHGDPFVVVRRALGPEDVGGLVAAAAVLTARGGQTSHAAVVARGMGKPCIVGCRDLEVGEGGLSASGRPLAEGDWITVDGNTGEVLEGRVDVVPPMNDQAVLGEFLAWADAAARLVVRANADTPADARRARQLGARGIGLCRTEHMFFAPEALAAMRQMIVASHDADRARALARVLPLQREMFAEIFRAMDGLPVTIRLLDPPLHEFLPHAAADIEQVALDLGVRTDVLRARLVQLQQVNPMLGHRGCRVGVTAPQVYRTQTRAIFEAACQCVQEGVSVRVEVMIPLVSTPREVEICRQHVTEVAEEVLAAHALELRYRVGSMIEVPRACLDAKAIARHSDFFSFGTNDLSQLAYGFSRDDIGSFLPAYLEQAVLTASPFQQLDEEGVGQLVRLGTQRGRHANARLVVGACGEHAGDAQGVRFFHDVGLDYVSCSPFRVPVARLAAAWAALGLPPSPG